MAYASNQIGLGSYINPNDLLPDEVLYELELRNINMTHAPLEEQRVKLRSLQLDELRSPKVLKTNKTIEDELSVIQVKLVMIRQDFEAHGGRERLISRLRHLRLRVIRLNAVNERQTNLKEELLDEIEFLFDTFGHPEDKTPMTSTLNERGTKQRSTGAIPRNPALEFPLPNSAEDGAASLAVLRDNPTEVARETISGLRRPRVGFLSNSNRRENLTSNQSTHSNDSFNHLFQGTHTLPPTSTLLPSLMPTLLPTSANLPPPLVPPPSSGPPSTNPLRTPPLTIPPPPSYPPPSTGAPEEWSPETPTIEEHHRLRAEVSRIVEDVLSSQLENMMVRISQGMQEMQRRAGTQHVENVTRRENAYQDLYSEANHNLQERGFHHIRGEPQPSIPTSGFRHNRVENQTSTPIQMSGRVDTRPPLVADAPRNEVQSSARPMEQLKQDIY